MQGAETTSISAREASFVTRQVLRIADFVVAELFVLTEALFGLVNINFMAYVHILKKYSVV